MKNINNIRKSIETLRGSVTRREFVASSVGVLALSSLSRIPASAHPMSSLKNNRLLTVQEIIDLILRNIPGAPFKETTDTLKIGNPDQQVTGIVTTMFATLPVIQRAIELHANFIIAHEPTFYNHSDDTAWLEHDNVYIYKRDLLQRNSISVWRFHDYIHTLHPDGVLMGVLKTVGWDSYYDEKNPRVITLPPTALHKIISLLKGKLGIAHVKFVGDLSQICQRVAILPGAPGGRRQIQLLQKEQPDVLICGEIQEWETNEYVRDEVAMGIKRSLVVLGHTVSEEPGMNWLVDWLKPKLPDLAITHIPSGDTFVWA